MALLIRKSPLPCEDDARLVVFSGCDELEGVVSIPVCCVNDSFIFSMFYTRQRFLSFMQIFVLFCFYK